MNPVNVPVVPDAGPEYGTIHTIIWVTVYILLIGGAVAYLVWKLPRWEDGSGDDG